MRDSLNPIVCLVLRLYIGGVFVFASVHKIAHPGSFALDVATYAILPLFFINPMAIILPWVEIIVGVLTIAGIWVKTCAALISAMMVMFIIALSFALANGMDVSCGCFASSRTGDSISGATLVRDLGWLLISIYIFFADNTPIGIETFLIKRRQSK